jgi:hypothetical protein
MSPNLVELHNRILCLARLHRKTEARLIDHLQEAEKCRLFLHRGHSSLFRYVCDELRFSEAMTSNLITVARKAREIPELKEEIRKGNLSVSKLRKVCPVIDEKNQKEWIEAAKTCTKNELERRVASENTNHVPRASVRAIAKDTVRLSLDLPEESREKIQRLKDLLSSKKNRDCSLQEVIDLALESALDKYDPIRKAKRAENRNQKMVKKEDHSQEKSSPSNSKSKLAVCPRTRKKPKRKALSKDLIHKLQVRDRGCCTYVSEDGRRCRQTRWLHFHVRQEVVRKAI